MILDDNHPLDRTHQEIVKHRSQLTAWFDYVKAQIAVWEPRPVPDDFR